MFSYFFADNAKWFYNRESKIKTAELDMVVFLDYPELPTRYWNSSFENLRYISIKKSE